MRHSWFIAITARPDALRARMPAGRATTQHALADGCVILIATTPDVAVREEGGRISLDPLPGTTLVSVDTASRQVQACRGLLEVLEVYWSADADGLIAAGSLADLLPFIASRRMLEASVVEHHLFRWNPGERTYFEGVFRLLPGHELTWKGQGPARTRQVRGLSDLISGACRPVNRESADLQVEALCRAVKRLMTQSPDKKRAVLYSGGIDSSVVQMVIERVDPARPLQTRSFIVDTPEFQGDVDYCRDGVHLFGSEHAFTHFGPADFPGLVVDSIARLGRPFAHDSLAPAMGFYRDLAPDEPNTFWSGEAADAIYGSWSSRPVRLGFLPHRVLRALGAISSRIAPRLSRGAHSSAQRLLALRDEVNAQHPMNRFSSYCDLDTVIGWFGERLVGKAMAERRALVTTIAGPISGVERVQMGALFASALVCASVEFQLAAASGCTILIPYLDEGVMRAVLQVDPKNRYFYKGQAKPLLRLALEKRTGREFVARPKRDGGFYNDLCGWMRDGVLADLVRSIERPAFADAKTFRDKINAPDWTTWNLLLMDLYVRHLRSLAVPARASAALPS